MFAMKELWDYLLTNLEDEAIGNYLLNMTELKEMLYYGSSNTLVIQLDVKNLLAESICHSLYPSLNSTFSELLGSRVVIIVSQMTGN